MLDEAPNPCPSLCVLCASLSLCSVSLCVSLCVCLSLDSVPVWIRVPVSVCGSLSLSFTSKCVPGPLVCPEDVQRGAW